MIVSKNRLNASIKDQLTKIFCLQEGLKLASENIEHLEQQVGVATSTAKAAKQKLETAKSVIEALTNALIQEGKSGEEIYKMISPIADPRGFALYRTAEKLTDCAPSSYFHYEDNRGAFEDLNGFELIEWLEKAKFGEITWVVACPGYEKMESCTLDKNTEEYKSYKNNLYAQTVKTLTSK